MDNSPPSDDQSTPELSPGDLNPPVRRSVRRRLVQSTLFPQKPQSQSREENGHGKAERDRGSDEDGDNCGGEEEDCDNSQSKSKRKQRGKTTPSKRSSEKSKGKRSCNTTPKKNLADLLNEEAPIAIPDLRLEAKITAEENSRMFAGRQIHPFFSSRKASKKNHEVNDLKRKQCAPGRVKKEINCGPIHVFERTTVNEGTLDWSSWAFNERIFVESNFVLESMYSSIAEGSVDCLSFDKLPVTSHLSTISVAEREGVSGQCSVQEEYECETLPRTSVISEDVNTVFYKSLKGSEDDKVNNVDSTKHFDEVWKPNIGLESRFLEERMKSYYFCCGSQPTNSLWTYKYQPKIAVEVCGNEESIKFLSEWLQHWHGKDLQISKDLDHDISILQDEDYKCSENDSDTDTTNAEASLKNVLLISGPVGSGKSAAIYACAREQGFKVLEVSASECRNGALVKQRFGEALESRQLKRSLANPICSPNKHMKPSAPENGTVTHESDEGMVDLIHLSDEGCPNATGGSGNSYCKETESCYDQNEVKPLILFEDVDITFLEDRGFIAAIQHISETAKGPIILTSNSHDPLLPENLDRLQIFFAPPSAEDLLCHMYKVCAAESANIQSLLLEQLVRFCEGDIRKAIMHLQFWCQGKSTGKARSIQKAYGSPLFDLESGHRMLPKLLPWDLPSQLAQLVEKEITDSLSREENSSLMERIKEEELDQQETHHTFMHNNETESIEAKKAAMLSRNCSANEYDELRAELDTVQELSDHSDTPFSCFRRSFRKQHEMVLSSDSEDELADNGCIICPDTKNTTLIEQSQALKDLPCSVAADMETESFIPITEECRSIDVSCVPESSFVPETIISNGAEIHFRTVSGSYVDEEVSVSNWLLVEANNLDLSKADIENDSDTSPGNQHVISEFCQQEEVEDSQDEHVEAISIGYQLMDESSRMDYRRLVKYIEKPQPLAVTYSVQNSWNRLRNCHTDLAEYVRSEEQHGLKIVNLAHEMSNLISETDILLSHWQLQTPDSVEPSITPSKESDAYSLYDTWALASTTAEHGFCCYAKSIAAVGSARGSVSSIDLGSEMLASRMARNKLSQRDIGTINSDSSIPNSDMSFKSETKSTLFDVLQHIVPTKSYTTLKGAAFYEYLSSLRCISRSEASRLIQSNETTRKRRRRADRHYLSTGALMLSPEEISSLGQLKPYRENLTG